MCLYVYGTVYEYLRNGTRSFGSIFDIESEFDFTVED